LGVRQNFRGEREELPEFWNEAGFPLTKPHTTLHTKTTTQPLPRTV